MDSEPPLFSQPRRSQIAPFILQLLLVPPIASILTLILLIPIDWLPAFQSRGAMCPLQSIDVLILAVVAFACGAIAAKWKPSLLLPSGVWIWLVPLVLLLLGALFNMTSPGELASGWYDLVCADGSNAGLAKYLIGYPTFACIGYAIGLYVTCRVKPREN